MAELRSFLIYLPYATPMMKVYGLTAKHITERIEALRRRFRSLSVTSSTSRFLNPDKVWAYEEMCQLEDFVKKARTITPPEDQSIVHIGHVVTVEDEENAVSGNSGEIDTRFHICSDMDVKYLVPDRKVGGRLISIESPIGKSLVGKRVGDEVTVMKRRYRIAKIEVSEYV